jgi:Zn-finger nucleic acid-binding protein
MHRDEFNKVMSKFKEAKYRVEIDRCPYCGGRVFDSENKVLINENRGDIFRVKMRELYNELCKEKVAV